MEVHKLCRSFADLAQGLAYGSLFRLNSSEPNPSVQIQESSWKRMRRMTNCWITMEGNERYWSKEWRRNRSTASYSLSHWHAMTLELCFELCRIASISLINSLKSSRLTFAQVHPPEAEQPTRTFCVKASGGVYSSRFNECLPPMMGSCWDILRRGKW